LVLQPRTTPFPYTTLFRSLTGTFTAAVNADLKVGSLSETITVSGETPIVDVQSVRRQNTVAGDVIADIPSSRAYGAIFSLIPAVDRKSTRLNSSHQII